MEEKILDFLANQRVCSVELFDNAILGIEECCDRYYSVGLSKAQVTQLIAELIEIRDTMIE